MYFVDVEITEGFLTKKALNKKNWKIDILKLSLSICCRSVFKITRFRKDKSSDMEA